MKDPELKEAIEKCNPCVKCDSMEFDPSDYWEFICNSPEKAGVDKVEGVPIPHRKYCGSCRENDCRGKWFVPRSPDKKPIEDIRNEYEKKYTIKLMFGFILFCIVFAGMVYYFPR